MSTIERIADLLSQIEPVPIGKSPEPGPMESLDSIERAVNSRHASRFERLESEKIAGHLDPIIDLAEESNARISNEPIVDGIPATFRTNRVLPGLKTEQRAREVKIDREHLRRQGLIQPNGERTPVAECFRLIKSQLLTNLAKSEANSLANVIMITSALAGEGKTFCATNLAISLAQEMDRSVLLVDADVVLPSILHRLGVKAEKGLIDILLDHKIDLAEVLYQTDIGRLAIMHSGSANQHSTELLASERMGLLIGELAGRYDDRIVIFDAPPLLSASEAAVLAERVGQIVVVVEAGKTSESVLGAALDRIDASKVAGTLLNKGESRGAGYYYGGYGGK